MPEQWKSVHHEKVSLIYLEAKGTATVKVLMSLFLVCYLIGTKSLWGLLSYLAAVAKISFIAPVFPTET